MNLDDRSLFHSFIISYYYLQLLSLLLLHNVLVSPVTLGLLFIFHIFQYNTFSFFWSSIYLFFFLSSINFHYSYYFLTFFRSFYFVFSCLFISFSLFLFPFLCFLIACSLNFFKNYRFLTFFLNLVSNYPKWRPK